MNRQQLMFVETHGQVLKRLQAGLFGTHTDWQILFTADQAKNNGAKSLEYAHEFITVHCDISQMEILIARSLFVREKARSNPRLAELMSNLRTTPAPPAIYFGIRDEQGLIHTPVIPWKP